MKGFKRGFSRRYLSQDKSRQDINIIKTAVRQGEVNKLF